MKDQQRKLPKTNQNQEDEMDIINSKLDNEIANAHFDDDLNEIIIQDNVSSTIPNLTINYIYTTNTP